MCIGSLITAVNSGCTNSNFKWIRRNVLNIYLIKYINYKSPNSYSLDFHFYKLVRCFLSSTFAAKSFCIKYTTFIFPWSFSNHKYWCGLSILWLVFSCKQGKTTRKPAVFNISGSIYMQVVVFLPGPVPSEIVGHSSNPHIWSGHCLYVHSVSQSPFWWFCHLWEVDQLKKG